MTAWIYWNPPRELFTLPFIDRPIAIYGVLFVIGFIMGYFILSRILKYEILASNRFSERDVHSWPSLIKILQTAMSSPSHPLYPVIQNLDRRVQQEIAQFQIKQDPNASQKTKILQAVNMAMQDPQNKWDKTYAENLLANAFTTSTEWGYLLTDRITWFVVLGTIIGSRLGHVFFYEWPRYQDDWMAIFRVWEGGLASHGGVLGVIIAGFLYDRLVLKDFPEITFIGLVDCIVVPAGLVAFFIRIGNFFNQEILGPETDVPWAIIFGDPADGGPIVPRHPSQLYEAIAYLCIFGILFFTWKKWGATLRTGLIGGVFFSILFTSRFFIEFIKLPQSQIIDETILQMGQYLSIPFILFGLSLLLYGKKIDAKLTVRAQGTTIK